MVESLQAAYNTTGLGARVGPVSSVTVHSVTTSSGAVRRVTVVDQSPADLARSAGVELEAYSLARLLASEGYDGDKRVGYAAAAVATAQTALNVVARASAFNSVTGRLTYSQFAVGRGRYGSQIGRWASTRLDPRRWHLDVARAVLAKDVPDLARGSVQFFAPSVQDRGTQDGNVISSADVILRRWHQHNAYAGGVPTVDPYRLMFLRPESDPVARASALRVALAVVEAGRRGVSRPTGGGSLVAVVLLLGAALAKGVLV